MSVRTPDRLIAVSALALALSGCIPQVEPPYAPEPVGRADPPPLRDGGYPEDDAAPTVDADIPVRSETLPPSREPQGQVPPPQRPAWEARPVAPDAREIRETRYTVRPGDTLGRIAERFGASEAAIAEANALRPPYPVRLGERLVIPPGRYHLVRPGQSGIAIARAYGIEWSRIVAANHLAEPYVLRAGQRIVIPGFNAAAPSLADRAAAFRLDIDDILTGGEPALAANQAPVTPTRTPRRVLPPTAVVAAPVRPLTGGFLWPVDGRVLTRFGPGASGVRSNGIEIAASQGTPVRATADGVVAYVGTGIASLGGIVIVKHGGGWTSVYGRASSLLVSRGQSVTRGQRIALAGDGGDASRTQLHFELRKGRTPVDPQTLLRHS